MNGNVNFLNPILEQLPPPPHTKIEVKCFTCQHFDICNIRQDYLQTALLFQRVLGDPDENYELSGEPPVPLPGFIGIIIEDAATIFPATIATTDAESGTFYMAKFDTLDNVRCVYMFGNYYVMMTYTYNTTSEEYDLVKSEEVFYNIQYTLDQTSLDNLQLTLLAWREDAEENPPPEPSVINTTAFSGELKCKFYDWIRNMSYIEGLKRIAAKYPNGIPLDDNDHYYHIATYHYEPNGVSSYTPRTPAYLPLPYPIYIPPKTKRAPIRRGDL